MEVVELDKINLRDEFWEDKKVLITGHTGFKGTWLSLWLKLKGAKVFGFSLDITEENMFFVETFGGLTNGIKNKDLYGNYFGDIRNFDFLDSCIKEIKPDIVFHLAAQSLVKKSYQDPIKTWDTNLIGTLNLLQSLKKIANKCVVVVITSDKVYENKEILEGYSEDDRLGGKDPYSASKAATEILVGSWRFSFCGNDSHQTNKLSIVTARSGNVVGGGDWSAHRIIPDFVKAAREKEILEIRNPHSIRPWQHVLDTLNGYILLAKKIFSTKDNFYMHGTSFNFGPDPKNNKTVEELIDLCKKFWPCETLISKNYENPYESKILTLKSEKAKEFFGWYSKLNFDETIKNTINWYKEHNRKIPSYRCCLQDIIFFERKK